LPACDQTIALLLFSFEHSRILFVI